MDPVFRGAVPVPNQPDPTGQDEIALEITIDAQAGFGLTVRTQHWAGRIGPPTAQVDIRVSPPETLARDLDVGAARQKQSPRRIQLFECACCVLPGFDDLRVGM